VGEISCEVCAADGDVVVFGLVAAPSDPLVLTRAGGGNHRFGVCADCLVRCADRTDSVAKGEHVGGASP
jgi:hypothetical protein